MVMLSIRNLHCLNKVLIYFTSLLSYMCAFVIKFSFEKLNTKMIWMIFHLCHDFFFNCIFTVESTRDKNLKLDVSPQLLNAEDFECSLCYRLLHLPVTTPCGHVFCRPCLDKVLDHKTECPLCKSSLAEVSKQFLGKITVRIFFCIFFKYRCH